MNNYKYRLIEQEEGGEESGLKNILAKNELFLKGEGKYTADELKKILNDPKNLEGDIFTIESGDLKDLKLKVFGDRPNIVATTKTNTDIYNKFGKSFYTEIENTTGEKFDKRGATIRKDKEGKTMFVFPQINQHNKELVEKYFKLISDKQIKKSSLSTIKVDDYTLKFPVGDEEILKKILKNAKDKEGNKLVSGKDYTLEKIKSISEIKKNIKENSLSNSISQAIENIDPNMSYVDFAIAVADVIKNNYGSHNIESFIKVLNKELMTEEKVNKHNIILTLDNISLKKFKTIPTFKNLLFPNQLNSLKTGDNELIVNNTVLGTLQRMANPGGYSVKKINN